MFFLKYRQKQRIDEKEEKIDKQKLNGLSENSSSRKFSLRFYLYFTFLRPHWDSIYFVFLTII